jgi:hypothetical protein
VKSTVATALFVSLLLVTGSARAIETPQFVRLSIEDRFGTVLDDVGGHPATATIRTDVDFVPTTILGVGTVSEGEIQFTMPTPDLMDDSVQGAVQMVDPSNVLFVKKVVNQTFTNGQVLVKLFAIDPGFGCAPNAQIGGPPLCLSKSVVDDGGPTDVSSSIFNGVAPFRVIVESGVVPEPATLGLFGLASTALVLRARRSARFR